ncbi:unnamed protein product [Rotaria sp. Silwood1]|nr:unnamed protein product [Rotaria sp. Silwood1]CAF1689452.1 unnamed protein product [Rotaria sp. Silwood1]
MNDEVDELEKTNQLRNNDLKNFKEEKKGLQTEEEQCITRMKDEEQDQMEKEVEKQKIDVDEHGRKLLDEWDQLNQYEQQRDRCDNQKCDLEQEKQSIEREKLEIERQMRETREYIKQLEEALQKKYNRCKLGFLGQKFSQKEQECVQLNIQEDQINQQLQSQTQEYDNAERTMQDKTKQIEQLEAVLKAMEEQLHRIETDLKKSNQDLENEKRLFQRLTSELKTAERNERKAATELRNQEQKLVREEQNLQRCREKEQAASRRRQETEHEVEMMETDLEIATAALLIADLALTALIALTIVNPLAGMFCIAIKQAAVTAAQHAVGKAEQKLGEKKALLVKRVSDHETAQANRKKSEEILNVNRINLDTRKSDLTNRKQDVVTEKDKLSQQKTVVENVTQQSKGLRNERGKIQ